MDYNNTDKEKRTKTNRFSDNKKARPSMDADKDFVDGDIYTANDSPDDF